MPFPEQIITFPDRMNISENDAVLIKQYQEAMEEGNLTSASEILHQITDYDKKIISTQYLNLITQTVFNLQKYYLQKYSPSIVVSSQQPVLQDNTDLWFQITGSA